MNKAQRIAFIFCLCIGIIALLFAYHYHNDQIRNPELYAQYWDNGGFAQFYEGNPSPFEVSLYISLFSFFIAWWIKTQS